MRNRGHLRGFSVIELLVAAALLCVVFLLSLLNYRAATGKANARALASVVADQLRLARQDAMAHQEPVAVCFPSEGRSKPHSQGFYVARGLELPRMARVVDFSTEYAGAVAFVGTWPESSGTLTLSPPAPGTKAGRVDLQNWLNSTMKQDYCFVFTPEGGVVTNGLAHFAGAYHILCSAGAQYGGGGAPAGTAPVSPQPAYFTPTALGETYSVSVSPSGAVSVRSGVAGSLASLVKAPAVPCTVPPAMPPGLAASAASRPVVASVEVYPKLDPSVLPPGVDVMVQRGGHVTLVVTANDPRGEQLFLQWTCTDGTFSYPGEEKMQWNPARKAWVSHWQWQPPDTASPGQQFNLTCSVRNLSGLVAVPVGPTAWSVGITPPGLICFQRRAKDTTTNGYSGGYDIMVMNPDGGECRPVIQRNSFVPAPSISRDGTKIAWCEVGANGYQQGIWVANSDGSDPRNIYSKFGILPAFSPMGDKVAFISIGNNSAFNISVIGSDGTGPLVDVDVVAVGGYGWDRSSWSPDGQKLCYQKQPNSGTGTTALWTRPVDGSAPAQMLVAGGGEPSWSPDLTNKAILYDGPTGMARVDETGAALPAFPGNVYGYQGAYSPDGSEILFTRGDLFRMDSTGAGGLKQITTQQGSYGSWGP
ncbi:MAG: hypothetical protein AB1758_21035 [Candidatus Eremiobacterota bacterium]